MSERLKKIFQDNMNKFVGVYLVCPYNGSEMVEYGILREVSDEHIVLESLAIININLKVHEIKKFVTRAEFT